MEPSFHQEMYLATEPIGGEGSQNHLMVLPLSTNGEAMGEPERQYTVLSNVHHPVMETTPIISHIHPHPTPHVIPPAIHPTALIPPPPSSSILATNGSSGSILINGGASSDQPAVVELAPLKAVPVNLVPKNNSPAIKSRGSSGPGSAKYHHLAAPPTTAITHQLLQPPLPAQPPTTFIIQQHQTPLPQMQVPHQTLPSIGQHVAVLPSRFAKATPTLPLPASTSAVAPATAAPTTTMKGAHSKSKAKTVKVKPEPLAFEEIKPKALSPKTTPLPYCETAALGQGAGAQLALNPSYNQPLSPLHTTLLAQQQQHECQTVHLEKMAECLAKMHQLLAEQMGTHEDPKLRAFAQCTADVAQLTYAALAELSGRIGNQSAHINGILLRRGSAAGNTLGGGEYLGCGGSKGDKLLFQLSRCDRRPTLYDPDAGKKANLVEIFERFSLGKPKWHSPEDFTMALTEYVLNTLYPVETEKWTYCVRYSSRNGHRTVPHVLIEELKMQIAKGFNVFNTAKGAQTNLAIGAAVVNKATRFFNAKRRVSTRASQRKLASVLNQKRRSNSNNNNNETSSNKSCSSVDFELDEHIGPNLLSNSLDEPAEKLRRSEESSVSTRREPEEDPYGSGKLAIKQELVAGLCPNALSYIDSEPKLET